MPIATQTEESYFKCLLNKWWRLTNLYLIEDGKTGEIVPFKMRPFQERFLRERHPRNFVPKARKYGMSTVIVIDYLDDCIFAPKGRPVHAVHLDITDDDATAKLAKARLAWDRGVNHPNPAIRDLWNAQHMANKLIRANDHELAWANGSRQEASTSIMGGNPNRLHISEFGPLAHQFPAKSEKMMRGSFPAVPIDGTLDIETTVEGGPVGDCYTVFKTARANMQVENLAPTEFKLFFIPWMAHPDNILVGRVPEKPETKTYFDKIEAQYQIKVGFEQQAWYESTKKLQKWNMFTQHPTVLDECLTEGGSTSFFDVPGMKFQRDWCVGLETQIDYGDLTLQGELMDFETRSVTWRNVGRELGWLAVFEPPLEGERYILFADFCVGKQSEASDKERDTNAFGIIRDGRIHPITAQYRPPQVVASCRKDDQSITPETIRRIVLLSIYYGDCCIMPEINNKDDIANRIIASGGRHLWRLTMMGADGAIAGTTKTQEVFGWLTSDTAQGGGRRGQMLDRMQELTLQHDWIATFPWIVDQMATFHINKKGRPESAPGHHDDFVTGPAMALHGLPQAREYKSNREKLVQQFQKEFGRLQRDPRRP